MHKLLFYCYLSNSCFSMPMEAFALSEGFHKKNLRAVVGVPTNDKY